MPEEGEAGHNAHEIDQDNGWEFDVAGALTALGIESHEQIHDSQFFQEVEVLVKKPGLSKAIDLGDLLAFGQVFGDPRLVSGCGAPSQSFSDPLGCLNDEFHGNTSLLRVLPMVIYARFHRMASEK
jgi:hypothetical protein